MGLFSFIRKSQPGRVAETQLGAFTLAYSKRKRNIWTNRHGKFAMSVRGTEFAPDPEQLEFLQNIDGEIQSLNEKILKRFVDEFEKADLEIDFGSWQERFKLVAVQVTQMFKSEAYWDITFEDLKEPYDQFTLYIEGQNITDFYVDK